MPIDPLRLLNWTVPDKVQALSRQDAAFYALSVGWGQNACDQRSLRYVDPSSDDFVALPSMVLVMGYPGFWLGDPNVGVDSRRVMHAEQTIEILGPIPIEDTIVGRTRVTDLVDRGREKGAFLYTERGLFDAAGRNFAQLRQTHILRGDGGFGGKTSGPAHASRPCEGEPRFHVDSPIRPEQALLYRLNGDMNPIHSDPTAAREAGFPKPLLHGMCTFGFVAQALVSTLCDFDARRLRTMSLRFTGPVFPGETLRTEIFSDNSFRARSLERNSIVVDFGRVTIEDSTSIREVEKNAV